MIPKRFRLALVPAVFLPPFLGLALLSGCGGEDNGTHRIVPLTEENKANIAAEQASSEAAKVKTKKGQP